MNGLILYESKLLALLYTVFIFLSDTEKANFLCWLDVSNPVWLSLMPLSGSFHFLGEPIWVYWRTPSTLCIHFTEPCGGNFPSASSWQKSWPHCPWHFLLELCTVLPPMRAISSEIQQHWEMPGPDRLLGVHRYRDTNTSFLFHWLIALMVINFLFLNQRAHRAMLFLPKAWRTFNVPKHVVLSWIPTCI